MPSGDFLVSPVIGQLIARSGDTLGFLISAFPFTYVLFIRSACVGNKGCKSSIDVLQEKMQTGSWT